MKGKGSLVASSRALALVETIDQGETIKDVSRSRIDHPDDESIGIPLCAQD